MRVHPSPAPSPYARPGEHIALTRLAHGWRIEVVSVDRQTGRPVRSNPVHEQSEDDARRLATELSRVTGLPVKETP